MDDVLISKAAAIDALKRAAYWQDAERKIAELPAVDAVPVVHARWKPLQEDVYWGNSLKRMYCDVCNNQAIFDSQRRKFILTCFCPNCGAKMDGRETDE